MSKRRVRSSNLRTLDYNVSAKTLTVTFRSGAVYRLDGVRPRTVHALLTAPSKGKFFHKIAPRYDATRLRKWRKRS